MDAIQQAITGAHDIAQELTRSDAAILEASVNSRGQVTPFTRPSMAMAAQTAGIIPKLTPYIRVNEFGILIGKSDRSFKTGFNARILMVENRGFKVKHTIRFGNPATYLSTYDGQTCDKGGSWYQALMNAKAAGVGPDPYMSVDVLVALAQDVRLTDQTLTSGTRIGFTASMTNFDEWSMFFNAVAEAGKLGQEVHAQLGHHAIHHNKHDWGVVTFTLVQDPPSGTPRLPQGDDDDQIPAEFARDETRI